MSEIQESEIRRFIEQIESTLGQTSETEISDKIKDFLKQRYANNPPEILLWEQRAFNFIENYSGNKFGWGTYFGPMFIFPNEEGNWIEYPSIQEITPEIIAYWERRAKESNHPIFKARYSNLVWDFSEKVKGEKPNYSIAQIFIDSVIEIVEKDLHKCPTNVIEKLERALSLALNINDKVRLKKLVGTITNYEEKIAEDTKPGLWGFSYELLVKNKKIQLDKEIEQKIIRDLEERYDRLLKYKHPAAKKAAHLLVDYYSSHKDTLKVKNILLRLETMIQAHENQAMSLLESADLKELYHLYLQHGLKDEADKVLIKIRELGKKFSLELSGVEISTKIPKEEIEKFINKLIEGDLKTAMTNVAIYFIPKKSEVKQQLENLSAKTFIPFLFTRKILDREGRIIAEVGPIDKDIEGHIVLQISQNMEIIAPLLRETIMSLIKKFELDTKSIINYLYESPIFNEKRKEFFVKAIEAYLSNNYFVALHILIPQIEALIRNLAEKIGLPVLKGSRFGGLNYRTLDELLRDEEIVAVLTEDLCLYLRTLFTDQRGWNLRNNICHGISFVADFNQHTADRVFHVLLCLSLIR